MIGRALTSVIAETDVVARLGGDEFAVLLKDADRARAQRVADVILETVSQQALTIGTLAVTTTASIGVVAFRDSESGVDELLAAADMAMYAAKEAGGNRCHMFDRDDAYVAGMQARLAWADRIRRALDEDRFVLYWQPIIELRTGVATHHEVLLRMVGDDGEIIAPGRVHRHRGALRADPRDRSLGRPHRHPPARRAEHRRTSACSRSTCPAARWATASFPELVEREIALTGIDPGRLVFEITETAAIANMEQARAFAERLTRLGCRFALDDFGAGFSSFYYLKHLPLDYLKIDGDFIRNLTTQPDGSARREVDGRHRPRHGHEDDRRVRRGRGDGRARCARWASTTPRATSTAGRRRSSPCSTPSEDRRARPSNELVTTAGQRNGRVRGVTCGVGMTPSPSPRSRSPVAVPFRIANARAWSARGRAGCRRRHPCRRHSRPG